MKWAAKQGDLREREGFLWWPKCIAGQWRWFEFARWRECYQETFVGFSGYSWWEGVRWLE